MYPKSYTVPNKESLLRLIRELAGVANSSDGTHTASVDALRCLSLSIEAIPQVYYRFAEIGVESYILI